MVIYFSSTGNCMYAAEKVARATNDIAISITDLEEEISVDDNEDLGFVFPTYFLGLPKIVEDILMKIKINTSSNTYVYSIMTHGTFTGSSTTFLKQLLQRKHISIDASFSLKTVDNWTPMFDVSNSEKVEKRLDEEGKRLKKIILAIKDRYIGESLKGTMPYTISKTYHKTYEKARETKNFTVDDTCIGCTLCERNCPSNAIIIKDNKPIWVKDKCTMCLACLHRCPRFAIQYGTKTRKHGQYYHPM